MTLPEVITDNGPIDRNFRALDDRTLPVEAPIAPTFATGWSNFGGTWQTVAYYKDRSRVYLRGAVANGGTGTGLIFTLPAGYRPAADAAFPTTILLGAVGLLKITSTGTVTDMTFSTASKTFLSLSGISFTVN